ncbi:unnamed protein product, partial [marine sediment metagenome]
DLAIPILYGQLKISTNAIYQSDPATTVYRCDALCAGEINDIFDIRVNDMSIGGEETITLETMVSRQEGDVKGNLWVAYYARHEVKSGFVLYG